MLAISVQHVELLVSIVRHVSILETSSTVAVWSCATLGPSVCVVDCGAPAIWLAGWLPLRHALVLLSDHSCRSIYNADWATMAWTLEVWDGLIVALRLIKVIIILRLLLLLWHTLRVLISPFLPVFHRWSNRLIIVIESVRVVIDCALPSNMCITWNTLNQVLF